MKRFFSFELLMIIGLIFNISFASYCYYASDFKKEKQVEFILGDGTSNGLQSNSISVNQVCPYCKSTVSFQSTICINCKKDFIWPEKINKNRIEKETENYTRCKANIANISIALLMYSSDNCGAYPDSLNRLVPAYIKTLPTCPSCHNWDYAYDVNNVPNESHDGYDSNSCNYTIYCIGNNHKFFHGIENKPKYSSQSESFIDQ